MRSFCRCDTINYEPEQVFLCYKRISSTVILCICATRAGWVLKCESIWLNMPLEPYTRSRIHNQRNYVEQPIIIRYVCKHIKCVHSSVFCFIRCVSSSGRIYIVIVVVVIISVHNFKAHSQQKLSVGFVAQRTSYTHMQPFLSISLCIEIQCLWKNSIYIIYFIFRIFEVLKKFVARCSCYSCCCCGFVAPHRCVLLLLLVHRLYSPTQRALATQYSKWKYTVRLSVAKQKFHNARTQKLLQYNKCTIFFLSLLCVRMCVFSILAKAHQYSTERSAKILKNILTIILTIFRVRHKTFQLWIVVK